MDIVGYLGSIGGTLGLFLGISVFSLCELIHVLVECCLRAKQLFKTKTKNKKIFTDDKK
jgi:hypothetical protein